MKGNVESLPYLFFPSPTSSLGEGDSGLYYSLSGSQGMLHDVMWGKVRANYFWPNNTKILICKK